MGIKSFWLSEDIDEKKLKQVAEKEKKSISKLVSSLLKVNYDVLKNVK
jgi:uncharacterized OsmC-like protein